MFSKIINFIKQAKTYLTGVFSRLTKKQRILASVFGILIVSISGYFVFNTKKATEGIPPERQVVLREVGDLSLEGSQISAVGSVESTSGATIRAERSGVITRLNYSLGDYVYAGGVIAEMENSAERAGVVQAQASYDKVKKGVRTEQMTILEGQSDVSKTGALTAILNAYSSADSAIRASADKLFTNPQSLNPQLSVSVADSQAKTDVENARVAMNDILKREKEMSNSLNSSSDLNSEFNQADLEMRKVRDFLDMLVHALNSAISTTQFPDSALVAYKSEISGARSSVTGAISSLSSAKQGLTVGVKTLEQSVNGAEPEDLTLSRAGLSVAQANLEKTIIRAPLSGNLNSLSLKRGDFVQAYTPVASIANNGSLEMVAYLNEQDASLVKVGQSVKINNENSGVVTKIAPALDSLTKKIEIKIAIVDGGKLVNGQSANISIPVSKDKIISNNQSISIPLSSLKILSDRMVIFTVDSENKLVSHDVKIGRLLGDRVEILSGLTNDMKIVEDARGLRDGEIVVVK